MKFSPKKLITAGIIFTIVVILGISAVLFVPKLQKNQASNTLNFEKFGFAVMPGGQYRESIGELGTKQLPATFSDAELTPEERVVASLINTRSDLIDENYQLRQTIENLEKRLADLEDYKAKNVQYAPEMFNQELARVLKEVETNLTNMPESDRFSTSLIELMAIAAQQEYINIVRTNDLILDEASKSIIVRVYLPSYSFCVGNALNVAVNSRQELQSVKDWLIEPNRNQLSAELKSDLDLLLPPCQLSFRSALKEKLSGAIRG